MCCNFNYTINKIPWWFVPVLCMHFVVSECCTQACWSSWEGLTLSMRLITAKSQWGCFFPQEGARHFHLLFPYEVILLTFLPRLLKTFWENESQIKSREGGIYISHTETGFKILVFQAGLGSWLWCSAQCYSQTNFWQNLSWWTHKNRKGGLPQGNTG